MISKRRLWSWLIVGLPVVLATATWFVFPVPFVRGLLVGVVTGAIGIVVGFRFFTRWIRRRMGDTLKPPPLPGTKWDYELQATDLEGNTFDFAACKGRPLVLNHWATWCGPCVAEMPSLVRLRSALSDVEVEVACVSRESAEKVREFMARKGFDLPVLTVDGSLPECFSSRAIPATYVLDRSGLIVFRHLGAAAWDDPSVVSFIRNLAQVPKL